MTEQILREIARIREEIQRLYEDIRLAESSYEVRLHREAIGKLWDQLDELDEILHCK